ncbi:hypothetical protein Afer_0327 [Acidimicrobium ferrooxidans DSM 10331]|uniref:Uncharacterized protein n=1 Tax=Acidimicrobium ferrooxidans (strain DSM 10331 / JCM 15462 / NBRC 103882 / ICP) TaxID=525909 RepID=C7M2Q1_ACIFD|nr:hypothetical protein [Acidimicrobium ferrooxidans]ACU53295.1 hypothetical protein Afer_0327 [Acidimicrobium ferrooxidans DSM 10331]
MPEDEAPVPIRAHARIRYLGPVAPHWEIVTTSGDRRVGEEFAQRTNARLLMLPAHDPQFRRNQARVERDAEREGIALTWDLGDEAP